MRPEQQLGTSVAQFVSPQTVVTQQHKFENRSCSLLFRKIKMFQNLEWSDHVRAPSADARRAGGGCRQKSLKEGPWACDPARPNQAHDARTDRKQKQRDGRHLAGQEDDRTRHREGES
jgi:hypothetical protein